MAYSYVNYNANGSTQVFAVPFPYLTASHVDVTVDGVSVAFTWPTTATVRCTVMPGSGTVVGVVRSTPKDERLVDYQNASILDEDTLDKDSLQMLYIVQETDDYNSLSILKDTADGNFDADSNKLKNLADPTLAQDAVTKNYLDTTFTSQLSTAVTDAETAETGAQTAQTAAETAQTAAELAETNAETAQTAAELAETNAETAETNAETAETNAASSAAQLLRNGEILRPRFWYKDADEIYIGAAGWQLDSIGWVYHNSQLTYAFTGLTASTWRYLYLDASAIVTAGALVITDYTESDTAPTYSHTKKGWYNGADRCVFAVYGTGANTMKNFLHDGKDLVMWVEKTTDRGTATLTVAWVDVTLTIPAFSRRARITFYQYYTGSALAVGRWRCNGQSGDGHRAGVVDAAGVTSVAAVVCDCDSSQIVEVYGTTANSTLMLMTNGWYLPHDM